MLTHIQPKATPDGTPPTQRLQPQRQVSTTDGVDTDWRVTLLGEQRNNHQDLRSGLTVAAR